MQLLIPKSAEVSRTEHTDARRPEMMQQQFAATLQKKVDQDHRQVLRAFRPEQPDAVDKDGSNRNNQEQKKKNKNKQDEDKAKKSSTSMIDISI